MRHKRLTKGLVGQTVIGQAPVNSFTTEPPLLNSIDVQESNTSAPYNNHNKL